MTFKNLRTLSLFLLSISLSISLSAAEPATTSLKIYGFIGNDFYYNSRQNVDGFDGLVHLFPKPISVNSSNIDQNATPQAEMLSVNTRFGFDINGTPILGAKTVGKLEADFAGIGTASYVLRIRQGYMKLNWEKTELLIGLSWHPLFGNVIPSTLGADGGAPFQPFNRSTQVRLKQSISNTLSVTGAALYQLQYASMGPLGTTNCYLKNAIVPNLFVGLENKTTHWTTGAGVDFKTLKPDAMNPATISSLSATAYAQFVKNKFQVKAKLTYGENLTDQLMLGGYGVSKYKADSTTILSYTNFKNISSWVNIVYGTKLQVGLLLGASENLGTNENLAINKSKKFVNYGFGFYDIGTTQQILDRLYRIAPLVSYNLPNMKFGIEYDLTTASYGKLKADGTSENSYITTNNRILATVCYIF